MDQIPTLDSTIALLHERRHVLFPGGARPFHNLQASTMYTSHNSVRSNGFPRSLDGYTYAGHQKRLRIPASEESMYAHLVQREPKERALKKRVDEHKNAEKRIRPCVGAGGLLDQRNLSPSVNFQTLQSLQPQAGWRGSHNHPKTTPLLSQQDAGGRSACTFQGGEGIESSLYDAQPGRSITSVNDGTTTLHQGILSPHPRDGISSALEIRLSCGRPIRKKIPSFRVLSPVVEGKSANSKIHSTNVTRTRPLPKLRVVAPQNFTSSADVPNVTAEAHESSDYQGKLPLERHPMRAKGQATVSPSAHLRSLGKRMAPSKLYFHRRKQAWRAEALIDGAKRQKSFSCKLYGCERARKMCQWTRNLIVREGRLPTEEETCAFLSALVKASPSFNQIGICTMSRRGLLQRYPCEAVTSNCQHATENTEAAPEPEEQIGKENETVNKIGTQPTVEADEGDSLIQQALGHSTGSSPLVCRCSVLQQGTNRQLANKPTTIKSGIKHTALETPQSNRIFRSSGLPCSYLDQKGQEAGMECLFPELAQLSRLKKRHTRTQRRKAGKKPISGVRGVYFQQNSWRVNYRGQRDAASKLFSFSPGEANAEKHLSTPEACLVEKQEGAETPGAFMALSEGHCCPEVYHSGFHAYEQLTEEALRSTAFAGPDGAPPQTPIEAKDCHWNVGPDGVTARSTLGPLRRKLEDPIWPSAAPRAPTVDTAGQSQVLGSKRRERSTEEPICLAAVRATSRAFSLAAACATKKFHTSGLPSTLCSSQLTPRTQGNTSPVARPTPNSAQAFSVEFSFCKEDLEHSAQNLEQMSLKQHLGEWRAHDNGQLRQNDDTAMLQSQDGPNMWHLDLCSTKRMPPAGRLSPCISELSSSRQLAGCEGEADRCLADKSRCTEAPLPSNLQSSLACECPGNLVRGLSTDAYAACKMHLCPCISSLLESSADLCPLDLLDRELTAFGDTDQHLQRWAEDDHSMQVLPCLWNSHQIVLCRRKSRQEAAL
ncbi:hypothetical protein Efla_007088 [Eimeria flavescens]